MTQGPSEPGPTASTGAGEGRSRPGYSAREQVTRPRLDDPAGPSAHPSTEVVSSYQPTVPAEVMQPHEPTQVDPRRAEPVSRANQTVIAPQAPANPPAPARPQPQTSAAPGFPPPPPPTSDFASRQPASDVVRYGPGVPPSQAGVSAEQVWRTGQMPDPPRRPVRVRRLAGTIVTVILLAAAGVLLFLRFHHAPFHVTGTPALSSAQNGCAVNVTGRIPTNGASGTISYQWVFTPQQEAPQPLSQSVVSGQHAVYVTVAVQGQGHGTATEQVTLQVLGPNQETASTVVKVSC
jgi:hypothetical protein